MAKVKPKPPAKKLSKKKQAAANRSRGAVEAARTRAINRADPDYDRDYDADKDG